MILEYASDRVEKQCTSTKAADKIFGGDKRLSLSLLSRINALENAETIKDIIVQPQFRFHKLKNKGRKNLEGIFAIDVKTSRDPWRILLQPLNENGNPFVPCHIDRIADMVTKVKIMEVSRHYE